MRVRTRFLKEGYFAKGTGLARIHANFKRGVLFGNQAAVRELGVEIYILEHFVPISEKEFRILRSNFGIREFQ